MSYDLDAGCIILRTGKRLLLPMQWGLESRQLNYELASLRRLCAGSKAGTSRPYPKHGSTSASSA